jgi:hypothetical protein
MSTLIGGRVSAAVSIGIVGVSMAVTQRSEFASVVQRNAGEVRGLIALMRENGKRGSIA